MKFYPVLKASILLLLLSLIYAAHSAEPPKIAKVDPPNWWASMMKPMLLVQGENLSDAEFTLSDRNLRIDRTHVSSNGHWAELWLNECPSKAETVTVQVKTVGGQASFPYRFEERRASNDGFSGFSSRDAMYLIMTDRFADGDTNNDGASGQAPAASADAVAERAKNRGWHGGDLPGITKHLDYIQQTGFTTVWVTPVYANAGEPDSYHGYGATDMFSVDPHYGSLADLKELSAALHRKHMKLVLDTVPNHVGPKHPWVEDEPDPQWFHGTQASHRPAVGDFHPLVDPHAPWRDQQYVLEGWFANVLPDMNQENPATAQYLIQNAIWWIEETGADGLRIDTFPYVGRAFWHDFHAQLHAMYPQLTTVGEVFNCDASITSSFAGGVTRNGVDTGLDTPFDFPTYCALRDVFLKNQPMSRLAEVWRQDALFPHPERLVPFLGNHDNSRFLWNEGATVENMKAAFAILFTMRGMPQVYSGDEIAMKGGEDPDNRQDFPGGWPDAVQSAFTKPTPEQASMHDWVEQLLHLRASHAALQTGTMQVLSASEDVLAYVRRAGSSGPSNPTAGDTILVILNRSSKPAELRIPIQNTQLARSAQSTTLIGVGEAVWRTDALTVSVPGEAVWIAAVR